MSTGGSQFAFDANWGYARAGPEGLACTRAKKSSERCALDLPLCLNLFERLDEIVKALQEPGAIPFVVGR